MTAAIATTATRRSSTACRPRWLASLGNPRASLSALLEVSDAHVRVRLSPSPREWISPMGPALQCRRIPESETPGGRGPARGHQRRIVLPPRGPCVRAGPRFSPTGIGVCMYCPPRRGTGGRGARRMMAWHGTALLGPRASSTPPCANSFLLGWVDRQAPGSSATTLWFPAFLARFCSRHGRTQKKTMGTVASAREINPRCRADGAMGSEASG